MKTILELCCLILILASCQEQKGSSNKVQKTSLVIQNVDSVEFDFPIRQIISNSQKRKSEHEIDNGVGTSLKAIPKDILTTYLTPFSIKNFNDFSIEYDEYSRYYFFDYAEFDDFILFTIIHDDEVGYDNYYSYTFDKKKGVVRDVVLIGMTGADGGHWQSEIFVYSASKNELIVRTESELDEDFFSEGYENCYTREILKFETTYKFELLNTAINKKQIAQGVDTICRTE